MSVLKGFWRSSDFPCIYSQEKSRFIESKLLIRGDGFGDDHEAILGEWGLELSID